MNQEFMKTKPILPLVMTMSLPMMLSMLINSLYNIVDSMFVARLGEEALTAVSLVYPLQTLVTSVSVGFGVGINAAVAFFLGASQKERAQRAASLGTAFELRARDPAFHRAGRGVTCIFGAVRKGRSHAVLGKGIRRNRSRIFRSHDGSDRL